MGVYTNANQVFQIKNMVKKKKKCSFFFKSLSTTLVAVWSTIFPVFFPSFFEHPPIMFVIKVKLSNTNLGSSYKLFGFLFPPFFFLFPFYHTANPKSSNSLFPALCIMQFEGKSFC